MGHGVPEISITVIENNAAILDPRYDVAYRAVPAAPSLSGAADG